MAFKAGTRDSFQTSSIPDKYVDNMFEEAFDFQADRMQGPQSDPHPLSSEERWPPLGAAAEVGFSGNPETESCECDPGEKLTRLETEQEQLNASLMALTSHFAQVQFRLKQIVSAPKPEQEKLLKELEDFAFQGCPDVIGPDDKKVACPSCSTHTGFEKYEQRVAAEKEKRKMLSDQLKLLLNELEKYAAKEETSITVFRDSMPTTVAEKHSFLAEQLRTKLNLKPDEFDSKSPEDLMQQIQKAMTKLVNPGKVKEQVIGQLTGQIKEMEKFVDFLKSQEEEHDDLVKSEETLSVRVDPEPRKIKSRPDSRDVHRASSRRHKFKASKQNSGRGKAGIPAPHTRIMQLSEDKRRSKQNYRCTQNLIAASLINDLDDVLCDLDLDELNRSEEIQNHFYSVVDKRIQEASIAVMKKALAVLQIFAISQFGCSAKHFEDHMMRKAAATAASAGFHTPLTNLKRAVEQLVIIHERLTDIGGVHPDSDDEVDKPQNSRKSWSKPRSSSTSSQLTRMSSVTSQLSRSSSTTSINSDGTTPEKPLDQSLQEDLIRIVRGTLAQSLKELLQHGLCRSVESTALSTKALIGCMSSRSTLKGNMHAWEFFSAFYRMKHGRSFNTQPNVMLSEAFKVDLGGICETPKQSLLTVLHRIKTTHEPRKRSYDAMLKALVCAGLNQNRLCQWIRLVSKCPEIIERHYERWSYMARTGFEEVLNYLDKLTPLAFYLPEDLAIRHLIRSYNEFGDP